MILFVVLFPIVSALVVALLSGKKDKLRDGFVVFSTALTLLVMLLAAFTGFGTTVTVPLCGLSFTLDGFRCIYGTIVCFMWFVSSLLSPQYFLHHHNLGRYYAFFLLCQGFTAGVFLSADLYTTFLFFELMSIGSYVWVAQEETDGALDAGKTYLAIAVLGGLVTLMGLFLLEHLTGTLVIAQLQSACAAVTNRTALWAAAICILVGFGAKAGMFPLHIWLPKAHPVAPAPASALLSGVLTKAGIFGVLMITAQILPGDHGWGYLILILGCITMVLGALIAVFSVNLKHIFACSSLSQIGFILVGVSMICLLGEHNALAANGTVLYMMNHSLVKLVLFLFAGAVYMNTHSLDLNEIRGFGRGKPLLHAIYLMGAGSLAGIPGLCGYISKTLIHESIVEYITESGSFAITLVEWLFLFSGGLTTAYLTKVYVALFWQKPSANAHHTKRWGSPLTVLALCIAAVTLPVLGLLPHTLAERLTLLTLDFTGGHAFHHQVHYLAWVNLKGVVISVGIGLAVYFLFIARLLIRGKGSSVTYRSLWPAWFSLEDSVYKPLCRKGFRLLKLICRTVCDLPDALILLLRRTVLHPTREKVNDHPHSRRVRILARHRGRSHEDVSDHLATSLEAAKRLEGSLSFSLLMACLGLCAVLVFVVVYVFC